MDREIVPNEILSEPCSVTQAIPFTYLTEQCIVYKEPLRRHCIFLKFSDQFKIKCNTKQQSMKQTILYSCRFTKFSLKILSLNVAKPQALKYNQRKKTEKEKTNDVNKSHKTGALQASGAVLKMSLAFFQTSLLMQVDVKVETKIVLFSSVHAQKAKGIERSWD